jgi:hypothetical protein
VMASAVNHQISVPGCFAPGSSWDNSRPGYFRPPPGLPDHLVVEDSAMVGGGSLSERICKKGRVGWPGEAAASPNHSDDLFPLPRLGSLPGCGSNSRTARRSAARRRDVLADTNAAIGSLNVLSGSVGPGSRVDEASVSQVAAQQHIVRCIAAARPVLVPEAGAAARQLLGGRFNYGGSSSSVEQYDINKVSLQSEAGTVDLRTALGDRAAGLLSQDVLLEDDPAIMSSRSHPRAYRDALLRKSRTAYIQFVKRLAGLGMLTTSGTCKSQVEPFFVSKKNSKQRLVWDCRVANSFFREPPSGDMGAGEAMSLLQLGDSDLYVAQADVEN